MDVWSILNLPTPKLLLRLHVQVQWFHVSLFSSPSDPPIFPKSSITNQSLLPEYSLPYILAGLDLKNRYITEFGVNVCEVYHQGREVMPLKASNPA